MVNRYDYNTAADYARMTGYHRTTIVEWIKTGRISAVNKTAKKRNAKRHWKIAFKSFKPCRIRENTKPYSKHGKTWKKTELYILRNNINKSLDVLEKMIGRNKNSIAIKRCRIKRTEAAG